MVHWFIYWVYCSFPNIRSFTLKNVTCRRRIDEFSPQSLMMTAWSLSTLGMSGHTSAMVHGVSTVSPRWRWGKLNGFQLHGLQCWFNTQISVLETCFLLVKSQCRAWSGRFWSHRHRFHRWFQNRLVADESHCRCRSWGFPVSPKKTCGGRVFPGRTCGLSSDEENFGDTLW